MLALRRYATFNQTELQNQNHTSKGREPKSQHCQHTLMDVHENKPSKASEYRQNHVFVRSVERDDPNRNTASIPPRMFMKTNGRKTPNPGKNSFPFFPVSPFPASPPGTRAGARALPTPWLIKQFHWRYRYIQSALMNFLRLGYDSLTGAALTSLLSRGCCHEEIQPLFRIGSSRLPLPLPPVGHAA
jgi:hypothetical protein